jgi:predicted Zn-dependent protease
MSVPGGFIFFSQGIIDLCRDEAELAGVLAHEMMHVILGHGLKEIEKRPVQIRSDLAMAELESRTGKEPDPAKQDLERFTQEAYETIRKPRLQAYEVEADRCALILLAKAGYDPEALPSMISRVKDFLAEEGASRLSNPFLSMDFQNRYEEANRVIHSSLHNAKGVRNQDRYTANSKGTW